MSRQEDLELMRETAANSLMYGTPEVAKLFLVFVGRIALEINNYEAVVEE